MSDEEDKCRHCGQCCFYILGGIPSNVPCKHLFFEIDGKSKCKIYENRLSTPLDYGNRCTMRENSPFDYEGCPYNTGTKPVYRVNKIMVEQIK